MITREVLPKILHWVGKEKILILKGARQVGKTTLLNEVVAEIKKRTRRPRSFFFAQTILPMPPISDRQRYSKSTSKETTVFQIDLLPSVSMNFRTFPTRERF